MFHNPQPYLSTADEDICLSVGSPCHIDISTTEARKISQQDIKSWAWCLVLLTDAKKIW